MANFFDDLGAAFKKVANDVSNEVTIAGKEQQLKEDFQALGRMHFKAVRAGKEPAGEEFSAQVEKILLLMQEINQLRDNKKVPTDEDFVDM
ncbi:MAG: hypothetical protein IJ448_02355 [Oscillospiraceae bacterium]|nr:hypothetical protein [Oscillospiraceae bacterium]